MVTRDKKSKFLLASALAGALALSAFVGVSTPAMAEHGNNANLIGGLAAGAVVGGIVGNALANQPPAPPPPPPVYVQAPPPPQPVYVQPAPQPCRVIRGDVLDIRSNAVISQGAVRFCPYP